MPKNDAVFNQIDYQNDFNKQRYDRVSLMLPKGDRELIKTHAKEFDGGSLNAFINRAIRETMERDLLGRETRGDHSTVND